jgi:hypothetical protein
MVWFGIIYLACAAVFLEWAHRAPELVDRG